MANEIEQVTVVHVPEVLPREPIPQLTDDQRQLASEVRDEINATVQSKSLDFFKAVGNVVIKRLWNGDKARINKNDPVFKAILADDNLKFSQSNLWYAVRLHEPVALFGEAAASLSPSHQRRLAHAPEDKRHELARVTVAQGLTVKQLEDEIKKAKVPEGDKKKRGVKPLPTPAKRFSAVGSAVAELAKVQNESMVGLDAKRAKAMYLQVQDLKKLVEIWLPTFEKEVARVAGIGA